MKNILTSFFLVVIAIIFSNILLAYFVGFENMVFMSQTMVIDPAMAKKQSEIINAECVDVALCLIPTIAAFINAAYCFMKEITSNIIN